MASVDTFTLASPFNFPPACRFCHANLDVTLNIRTQAYLVNQSIDAILAQPTQPNKIVMCSCGKDGRCVPADKPGKLAKRRSIAEMLSIARMTGGMTEMFAKVSGKKPQAVMA